ncbi:hypothetical protein [Vibrio hepatarius]|uniref:hypothetical protein n=1 Tax=Vibrio hepatarius TaxID=171383 RepID=UPI00148BD40B|nr:hypothetical protein [Vibrio hepatarius]NOI14368.1 hypothetical protein [Vibrio hepatarius]
MDKSQRLLDLEIEQLRSRLEIEPEKVSASAEQCAARATQILYPEGEIKSLVIMSRCAWNTMEYRKGLKYIKEAYSKLSSLDTDDFLPEILHVHALHYWGQAKYFSAQQYWINTLEQSALVDEVEFQVEALIGLGNIWRITNDYELAKSTHELAMIVANHTRINWLEGKARILLAWDMYLLENYVEMLSVLDGAIEVLKDHPDSTWQAEIWDFRGLALLGLERIEDAEQATNKAHSLAVKHNLVWMKAHSYISRARLELLRKNPQMASELLKSAEQSAASFDNGELLSQICFQQSLVAEEHGDHQTALEAFKKYRKHSINMLREQTAKFNNDKARASKRQLEQRARKIINLIRRQHEFDPDKHLSNMVSEIYWWEQLVLFKTELKHSNHSVITIRHDEAEYIDICTELAHSLCSKQDILTRLSKEHLGLLLSDKGESAANVANVLRKMIEIYPWQRRGLNHSLPEVRHQGILTFPFTIEQLEIQQQEESDGSATE